MVLVVISEFSKLSLATVIKTLTPVSCYYMTSFKYGAKKATDIALTCRYLLSNIMPDSMGWDLTCVCVF